MTDRVKDMFWCNRCEKQIKASGKMSYLHCCQLYIETDQARQSQPPGSLPSVASLALKFHLNHKCAAKSFQVGSTLA